MELLAPAGGIEQLKAAVLFGADALYLASDRFGMRARACNFAMDELPSAIAEAHAKGVKVHVTCNVTIMQDDVAELPAFLEAVQDAGADALIIGDMGAASLALRHAPKCDLHVSTQANVANSEAAKMWHSLGAKRIVCAREMTLSDIAKMRENIPDDLEIEAFAHGAQCMAVSSRCLISSYLTGRSGNLGNCTQPCRWEYTLEEEKRPGVHFPIEEDGGTTFIMNAKDLNMIDHLHELEEAGVDSIKIEGRNKKAFYVACVVGAYRRALDGEDPAACMEELLAVSHRPYSNGFYYGDPQQACDYDGYEQETIHVADVVSCEPVQDASNDERFFHVTLRCRNKFEEGETLEVVSPHKATRELVIRDLQWMFEDELFQPVPVANRATDLYRVIVPYDIEPGSFVRTRQFRRSARH